MSNLNCIPKSYKYAQNQGTYYDEKNNKMLYDISNNLKVTGVSDGTNNQINPLMLKYASGVAGANPCVNDNNEYIETYNNLLNSDLYIQDNYNYYISLLLVILLILLFYKKN